MISLNQYFKYREYRWKGKRARHFLSSWRWPRGFPCNERYHVARLIGWQKVMSFHVGCTHARTHARTHACTQVHASLPGYTLAFPRLVTRSSFRSLRPRSCREIRSPFTNTFTFPNIRNRDEDIFHGKLRWTSVDENDEKLMRCRRRGSTTGCCWSTKVAGIFI